MGTAFLSREADPPVLPKRLGSEVQGELGFFLFVCLIYFYFWLYWIFVAARGLFSRCGEWGLLFVAVRGLLIAVASLVVEHGLQARRLQ